MDGNSDKDFQIEIIMKRKYILAASAVIMSAVACEPSHLEDNLYDPAVYLLNNGYQKTETFYDVQPSFSAEINAYCGSFYDKDPEVRLVEDDAVLEKYNTENSDTLKVLPSDCWSLEAADLKMVDKKAKFKVNFNIEALKALAVEADYSDIKGYAVPLRLKSLTEGVGDAVKEELGSVVIVPDMSMMAFMLDNSGVSETSLDELGDSDGIITLEYKVKTKIENRWSNGVKFLFNTASDKAEYPLLPEGSYSVTSSSEEGFVPGVSEIVYTVSIDKSKASGRNYSLVASVESDGGFKVEGNSESVINLFNRHYYKQSDISVRSCNSYVPTRGPELTIDGKLNTRWESGYSSTDIGVFKLPYIIEYELATPVRISDFDLYRRQDKYAADLKGGHLEVSSDGENYTTVCSFDYTGVTAYRNIHPAEAEPEARFVKFVVTASGRTGGGMKAPLSNLAEFNICYR